MFAPRPPPWMDGRSGAGWGVEAGVRVLYGPVMHGFIGRCFRKCVFRMLISYKWTVFNLFFFLFASKTLHQ